MAKTRARTRFFCTECGNETSRWEGQCPACKAWNTLVEEPGGGRTGARAGGNGAGAGPAAERVRLRDVGSGDTDRWPTGLDEFDFVLGGGIVPGSVVLIGGEPGIGKSTLILQVAALLEARGHGTLYASGEESPAQVRLRGERLGEGTGAVTLVPETELARVLEHADAASPDLLLVDSIQTVYTEDLDGAPGNVGQVRECAARLQRYAKQTGRAVVLVGHVTKGGGIAGPKTLEHIVDTVLYFEGASGLDHRVLRATKNRFGTVDEIGVFRMTGEGLEPVPNPSELFLRDRQGDRAGSAVFAAIEGSRPLLVEVQALTARASYGSPQRVANGFDPKRLALLLAVLERRVGIGFSDQDVFLNVVGGIRLQEPGADAAVAMALASALLDRPLPPDTAVIGEVGLGGELRGVGQIERRLGELGRMGMGQVHLPERSAPARLPAGVRTVETRDLAALARQVLGPR
jgi:DNA repair protein RadA/Sms